MPSADNTSPPRESWLATLRESLRGGERDFTTETIGRAVVLLAGGVGHQAQPEQVPGNGRGMLSLPIDAHRAVLDIWLHALSEIAEHVDALALDVRIAVDRGTEPPTPAPRRVVMLSAADAGSQPRGKLSLPTWSWKSPAVGTVPAGRPSMSIMIPLMPWL